MNPVPKATGGAAGITKPAANVTLMVSVSVKAVYGVKTIVQVVTAPVAMEGALKATPDTGLAAAGSASRPAPKPPRSKPSERAIGRILVDRRERSRRPVEPLHVDLRIFLSLIHI